MQTQSLFIHKNLSLQSCFLVEAAVVERKDSFHNPPSHFTRACSSKYHDKRCSLFEFLHILFASRSNTEGADCSTFKDDKNLHFRLGLNRCGGMMMCNAVIVFIETPRAFSRCPDCTAFSPLRKAMDHLNDLAFSDWLGEGRASSLSVLRGEGLPIF